MFSSEENNNATVGMCFLPKKLPRVLTPQLVELAAIAGLRLVAIDPHAGPELDFQLPRTAAPHADSAGRAAAPSSQVQTAAVAAVEQAQDGRSLTSTSKGNGTLDVVVHKLHRDEVWETALAAYAAAHPATVVLDAPAAIHATEDRAVMLAAAVPASGLTLRVPQRLQPSQAAGGSGAAEEKLGGGLAEGPGPQYADKVELEVVVEIPHQVVVETRDELRQMVAEGSANASGVAAGGLRPPLLLKTRRTDAAGGSGHGVAVVRGWAELEQQAAALQPPGVSPTVQAAEGGPGEMHSVPEWTAATVAAAETGAPAYGDALGPFEPLVVQQYVPHSQDLYKVYVLGRHVRVERRATLTEQQLRAGPGNCGGGAGNNAAARQGSEGAVGAGGAGCHVSVVHRISTAPLAHRLTTTSAAVGTSAAHLAGSATRDIADGAAPAAAAASIAGGGDGGGDVDEAVMAAVAEALSAHLGLTMFNFDVVLPADQSLSSEVNRDTGALTEQAEVARPLPDGAPPEDGGDRAAKRPRRTEEDREGLEPEPRLVGAPRRLRLCVVDVNYFPGYDKLQGWEAMMVEHLRAAADRSLAARRHKNVEG